jgi:hypothetical protein
MYEQFSASGGKVVKLRLANIPKASTTRFPALTRFLGQWTDAGRSAHSLSVDRQAWGTKGGLCWRATRDGLRHVPAGPPKPPDTGTNRDLNREVHLNIRFPGGSPLLHASFSIISPVPAYRQRKHGKSTLKTKFAFCRVPHLPGPEKTRSSPRAVFPREVLMGLPLGLVLGLGSAQLIPTH